MLILSYVLYTYTYMYTYKYAYILYVMFHGRLFYVIFVHFYWCFGVKFQCPVYYSRAIRNDRKGLARLNILIMTSKGLFPSVLPFYFLLFLPVPICYCCFVSDYRLRHWFKKEFGSTDLANGFSNHFNLISLATGYFHRVANAPLS